MTDAAIRPLPDDLYEADFYAWTQAQAAALRARRTRDVDWSRLAEEIADLGGSHKDEIESRLAELLAHLLKWNHQPAARTGSWLATIVEQRTRILRRIRKSPSLRRYPSEVLPEEYSLARRLAAAETELPLATFAAVCPFTIEEILDPDFLPDAPGEAP